MVAIRGTMPKGGKNEVEIAVCSIPALLAMKGYALNGRYKQKDAYDIYYCIRNYPGGPEALAEECKLILARASAEIGIERLAFRFIELERMPFPRRAFHELFWGMRLGESQYGGGVPRLARSNKTQIESVQTPHGAQEPVKDCLPVRRGVVHTEEFYIQC